MKNLIFSELNKIICRRSTYITLIISFLFVFFGLYIFELSGYKFTDFNGNIHKGFGAIQMMKKEFKELQNKNILPKKLTNGEVEKTIKNLKICNEKQLKATLIKIYINLLNNNYQFSDTVDPSMLFILNEEKTSDFYQARESRIQKFLQNNEFKLSVPEQSFWLQKSKQNDTPYDYGYYNGWSEFLDKSGFFIFTILAVCIAIAPVYSYEYQSGMDSIILASKYGKTKNNIAKILASFIFSTIVITFNIFLCLGVTLAIFGIEGWQLPIQTLSTSIAYPYSFFKLTLITIGFIYLVTFVMVALTLLLSSVMKTSFHVLIVVISILILPIIIGNKIKLVLLLPCKLITEYFWYSYISFSIFGKVYDIYYLSTLLYTLLVIFLIPSTIKTFKNHQVN